MDLIKFFSLEVGFASQRIFLVEDQNVSVWYVHSYLGVSVIFFLQNLNKLNVNR